MKTISGRGMLVMGTLMLLVGAGALFLGIALLVVVISGKSEPAMLIMETFLGLPGAFMVWQGIRQLRAGWGLKDGEVVKLSAPYAFRVTDSTIDFPEFYGKNAESWPRASTTSAEGSFLGFKTLKMEHPDRKSRRFFALGLTQTPEQVVRELQSSARFQRSD